MENSEDTTKKKKIPLFPVLKTSKTLKNLKGHPMLSDSSDDSDILGNISDYEEDDEEIHTIYSKMNNKIDNNDLKLKGTKSLKLEREKSKINLIPRPTIDAFRDIEEYVEKNTLDKNINNIYKENKIRKSEGRPQVKKENKKVTFKIVNDFYINNEGDIELTDNTPKDGKNNEENKDNTISLGPLMEEYENSNSIFINQNKSIFSSKKELWEFLKILLENHIFDMKSK